MTPELTIVSGIGVELINCRVAFSPPNKHQYKRGNIDVIAMSPDGDFYLRHCQISAYFKRFYPPLREEMKARVVSFIENLW
jgi:hypothetical protein